jgi:hypothetical protein
MYARVYDIMERNVWTHTSHEEQIAFWKAIHDVLGVALVAVLQRFALGNVEQEIKTRNPSSA